MITVGSIYNFIDGLYPFSVQPPHDNSGLIVGGAYNKIYRILVCLDATRDVVEEAKTRKAELIVSHHPLMYRGIKQLTSNEPAYLLAKYDISLISAHNNVDIAKGGISDLMLERLGGSPYDVLTEILTPDGYGRIIEFEKPFMVTACKLAEKCKQAFGCTVVRYASNGYKELRKIAVCGGSCGDLIETAISKGCDVLIGGDFKHQHWIEAACRGLALIDVGHFHSENIWCADIVEKLNIQFPTLHVEKAANSIDVCKYVV
jgi:dinuclear metal center YbgI/SA1388 family protein